MGVQGWKVPVVSIMVVLTASCGGEAESAAATDDQRLLPVVEAEDSSLQPAPPESPIEDDELTEPDGSQLDGAPSQLETPTAPPRATSAPPVLVRTDREPSVAPNEPLTLRPEVEASEPEPQPEALAVLAGTRVVLTVEDELSTEVTRTGDTFDAVVSEDVIGPSGMVLVPRGARVRGVVLESTESSSSDRPATLALGVEKVEIEDRLVPVSATVAVLDYETEARDSDTRTAAKVGAGAVAGALLGKIFGGDGEDALKGAVAGAAAGAAVAHATRSGHAKVPAGARMVMVLDEDMVVGPAPGGR